MPAASAPAGSAQLALLAEGADAPDSPQDAGHTLQLAGRESREPVKITRAPEAP